MEHVFDDIREERRRQDEKWGVQNHTPEWWLAILGEEYGEACKAALEYRFGNSPLSDYRDELVQVAAVATAMVECLDRHNKGGVYLAGPIKGCGQDDVHEWRITADTLLNFPCINPAQYRDFSQTDSHDCMNEIVNPDKNEIDSCSVLLANCWQVSVGTSQEILYAWERGKLVVSIVPEEEMISAWTVAHSHKICRTLEEACEYINSIAVKEQA